jgi:hypothetical protein
MRFIPLCLGLLFATPAAANSIEDELCGTLSASVVHMPDGEKLCRASVRSFAQLPASTSAELSALLTPENLATMTAMTSVWLGTQGIPVVGEAVDVALLALGVVLVAVQAAEVSQALWTFANRALQARSEADLREASASLAWAVSKVGVNVVAFILLKKAASKAPRQPAPPGRGQLVTSEGVVVSDGVVPAQVLPAAPAAGASGVLAQAKGRPSSSGKVSSSKKVVDPEAFAAWIAQARKYRVKDEPAEAAYQRTRAGPEEIELSGGGVTVLADGARTRDAHLLEAKYVKLPEKSPYILNSRCPDPIRENVRKELVDQFHRYGAIIGDPATPAVGLEIITNDARAAPFFEALLRETRTPGRVVVQP